MSAAAAGGMASTASEIIAFMVSISGWVLVSSTLPTDYWKVSTIDGTVITTATYWANLWKTCVTDSTGVSNCKDFPSMLALDGLHPPWAPPSPYSSGHPVDGVSPSHDPGAEAPGRGSSEAWPPCHFTGNQLDGAGEGPQHPPSCSVGALIAQTPGPPGPLGCACWRRVVSRTAWLG